MHAITAYIASVSLQCNDVNREVYLSPLKSPGDWSVAYGLEDSPRESYKNTVDEAKLGALRCSLDDAMFIDWFV